jgi:D-glycero-alpha-D-manno-heptose 1-phosphate guanylyltransferase
MEAIILAGGRGTRLSAVLPDGLPKALAPVAGRPFLHWMLERLTAQGFGRVIVSVGWQADKIVQSVGQRFHDLCIDYSREGHPLGTGGAIKAALQSSRDQSVFVFNGDTYLELDCHSMLALHQHHAAKLSIACVEVADTARYGRAIVEDGIVTSFSEKGQSGRGLINAGAYVIDRQLLHSERRKVFSFEHDFLATHLPRLAARAYFASGAFVDIGVPEDLARAQTLLARVPQ